MTEPAKIVYSENGITVKVTDGTVVVSWPRPGYAPYAIASRGIAVEVIIKVVFGRKKRR